MGVGCAAGAPAADGGALALGAPPSGEAGGGEAGGGEGEGAGEAPTAGRPAGGESRVPALLGTRVQMPPAVHLFQVPLEPVRAAAVGRLTPSLGAAYTSISQHERARARANRFEADLELLALTPRLAWQAAERVELAAAVPLFLAGSGALDRPIRGYHGLFGFPDAGRRRVPNDRFASSLVVDGRTVYTGTQGFGLGDLVLEQAWGLAGGTGSPVAVAVRTGVELPTGDAARGFGSGEVDLGAALAATIERDGYALHGLASWLLPGDLVGESRVGTHAAYGLGLAAEVRVLRRLQAVAQVDGRTPFVSGTGLEALDAPLLSLALGAALRVGGAWLAIGLAEDLRAGSAPDVTFWMRLSPRLD